MSTLLTEQHGTGKPLVSLTLAIADLQALHSSYMPFIKDGGLFVPTTQHLELHDEVVLQVRLVEEGKKLMIAGRVVWLSNGMGHRGTKPGVGIQFIGENRARVRQFLEELLGGLAKLPPLAPTY